MAQDETYITKVYLEHGGDRLVVGSDGELTLESGAHLSIAGAGSLAVGSGGNLTVLSGGQLSIATAGSMTIGSGGLMTIASGGALSVATAGSLLIGSGGLFHVASGGAISIATAGSFLIGSGGLFHVASGGAISVATAGSMAIGSGGLFHILSGGAFSIATGGSGTVGSGGTLYIHSGGTISVSTGGSIVMNSGATLALLSGGFISMASSVNWGLAGANVAADDLRRLLASEFGGTLIISPSGATSSKLSVINQPKNVRFILFSATSNMISASFWLASVSAGREVWFILGTSNTSNASTQIDVSLSGCTLRGSRFAALSGFEMHLSNSYCGVHLAAVEDNCWAIISQFGNIVE